MFASASSGLASATDRPAGRPGRRPRSSGSTSAPTPPGKSKGIYLLELDPASGTLTQAGARRRDGQPVVPGGPPEPAVPLRRQRGRQVRAAEERRRSSAFAIDPKTGHADAAEPAVVARARARATSTVDRDGQERPGGQLRRRQRGRPADRARTGGSARRRPSIQHEGIERRPEAAGGAARPLDQPRRREPVRRRGRPRARQAAGLPVRPRRRGRSTPNDPPFASGRPGSGPRHFAFHPDGRHAYVINEISLHRDRLRLRPRAGRPRRDPDGLDAPRGGPRPRATRRPRSRSIPRAGSSTARTGATTASRSSRSTPPPAGSRPSATSRPAARPRGTSASTRRAVPPGREPGLGHGRRLPRSTRRPAGSSRPAQTVEVPTPVCVKFVPIGE